MANSFLSREKAVVTWTPSQHSLNWESDVVSGVKLYNRSVKLPRVNDNVGKSGSSRWTSRHPMPHSTGPQEQMHELCRQEPIDFLLSIRSSRTSGFVGLLADVPRLVEYMRALALPCIPPLGQLTLNG